VPGGGASAEGLDVVERDPGRGHPNLFAQDARRRLVWMFNEHEIVVGKKPPALAVIIARILVPHQEDLPVRQYGHIRHELVHCAVHGDLPRSQSAPYARSKRSIRSYTRSAAPYRCPPKRSCTMHS